MDTQTGLFVSRSSPTHTLRGDVLLRNTLKLLPSRRRCRLFGTGIHVACRPWQAATHRLFRNGTGRTVDQQKAG